MSSRGSGGQAREELREVQAQLLQSRRELLGKDAQIDRDASILRQSLHEGEEWDAQEARARERVLAEIHSANEEFAGALRRQAQLVEAEHESELQRHLLEHVEESMRVEVNAEERRAVHAGERLAVVRDRARDLARERDSEAAASQVTREAFEVERHAQWSERELLQAEVRTRTSEIEAMEGGHRRLEREISSRRLELSEMTTALSLTEEQSESKEEELREVRQHLAAIQEAMDEVNGELAEQCCRVQRVEGSLRSSRDLGEQLGAMRGMLRESHAGLSQLCGLLEQERGRRDGYVQGLMQEHTRTERLLQLLHHFRGRAQELAPATPGAAGDHAPAAGHVLQSPFDRGPFDRGPFDRGPVVGEGGPTRQGPPPDDYQAWFTPEPVADARSGSAGPRVATQPGWGAPW